MTGPRRLVRGTYDCKSPCIVAFTSSWRENACIIMPSLIVANTSAYIIKFIMLSYSQFELFLIISIGRQLLKCVKFKIVKLNNLTQENILNWTKYISLWVYYLLSVYVNIFFYFETNYRNGLLYILLHIYKLKIAKYYI